MASDMQLDGMDALMRRLDELGAKGNRIANTALKKAAEPLAEAMRRNVNVSKVEHKHIRDDIQIGRIKTKDGVKYIEVGPGKETAWRAKFLEFGTSKMPAYPFVEPSVQESKSEVMETLGESLRQALF